MKKKGIKMTEIKLKSTIDFKFAHQSNAVNVALALCQAGYFVRIHKLFDDQYTVEVYQL